MTQIVLSDAQAKAVQAALEPVELRDQRGTLLGYVSLPPSEAELAEARRRLESAGPWRATKDVIDDFLSLEQG